MVFIEFPTAHPTHLLLSHPLCYNTKMTTDDQIAVLNQLGTCEIKQLDYCVELCCTFSVGHGIAYTEYGHRPQIVRDIYDKVDGLLWMMVQMVTERRRLPDGY